MGLSVFVSCPLTTDLVRINQLDWFDCHQSDPVPLPDCFSFVSFVSGKYLFFVHSELRTCRVGKERNGDDRTTNQHPGSGHCRRCYRYHSIWAGKTSFIRDR